MAEKNKKDLNHEMFTNKDGYVEGGKEIEMTNPAETPVSYTHLTLPTKRIV